jgi:hypothetical protein
MMSKPYEISDKDAFALAPAVKVGANGTDPDVKVSGRKISYTPKSLPDGLGDKWADILVHGEESWHYQDAGYPSRSELVMGATRFMLEKGFEHQVIYDVLLSPDLGISNHIYAQENVPRYGRRQIAQCLKSMNGKATFDPVSTEEAETLQFVFDDPPMKDGVQKRAPTIIKTLIHNAIVAIHKLGVKCEHNILTDIKLVNGKPFEDTVVTDIRIEAEKRFKVTFGSAMMREVVETMCVNNPVDPILNYLDNLPKWDGVQRVDQWLIDYCGATDTQLTRAIGRIILVAMVRRARRPGCQFDEMLILEGEQGSGKSTLLQEGLLPKPDWFTDNVRLDGKASEFLEDTAGHWLIECSELVSMRRADVEQLKAQLSRRVDKARAAYARSRSDKPRRFIVIGTTNQEQYLVDDTGNRRFWPVRTAGRLWENVDKLAAVRDQIWAEAVALEKKGALIRLNPDLYVEAAKMQAERKVDNPYTEELDDAVGLAMGLVKTNDIMKHLGIRAAEYNRYYRKVGEAMRELGFHKKQIRVNGKNCKCWQRGDDYTPIRLTYDENL